MDRDSVSGWIGPGGCWYSHIRGELLWDHWDLCLCVFCCLEVYLTRHMWHNCCTSVPSYWKSRYSLFSFGWSPAQTLQKFTIMQDSNEAVQDMPEVGWFWSCSDLWQILYVLTLFPMKSIIVGIGESVCVFCFEQTHIRHDIRESYFLGLIDTVYSFNLLQWLRRLARYCVVCVCQESRKLSKSRHGE